VSQENVSKFLGISSEASIQEFLQTIKIGDKNQTFHIIENLNENGIDLHQFAKQVIGFIDKHLLEDMDFYLQIAEMMGTIMRQIRFYPYPVVMYKVEVNKYLTATSPSYVAVRQDETKSLLLPL
jgi:hypothetical protein